MLRSIFSGSENTWNKEEMPAEGRK
jgi:hypothetical protein